MSRLQREQLITLVKGLEQYIDIWEQRADVAVLIEAQSLAEDLGHYLEAVYKNVKIDELIHNLEVFCELIYQASLPENRGEGESLIAEMRRLVHGLQGDMRHILPKHRQIVAFFPYKASMWDSLESIYLSMRDNPRYETYVVPIPYFDKLGNGSIGALHYEGDSYPKEIPITNWQEFSLEELKPDIAYIHNPYDNCNIVTTVHPAYYAAELKKHVKELVYVPYFVLAEIDPNNQKAVDRIAHFIATPGVIYADKVIVQSEAMKQIYVNEYIKFAKTQGLTGKHIDRAYQETRILGTGSPKLEKARHSRREDYELPSEWERLMYKSDGSGKKVFFYNTSITTLLNNGMDWVEKIADVLEVFKTQQADALLLWRPHPLIESTMVTMRPDVLSRYMEIKTKYIMEGWGIYDDSTDLNRAVAISDAYYGDPSSVVELFKEQKKPIMLQNCSILVAACDRCQ